MIEISRIITHIYMVPSGLMLQRKTSPNLRLCLRGEIPAMGGELQLHYEASQEFDVRRFPALGPATHGPWRYKVMDPIFPRQM